jgi:hypothetical protein
MNPVCHRLDCRKADCSLAGAGYAAHGTPAGAARGQADRRQRSFYLGQIMFLQPMNFHTAACRQVNRALAEAGGDSGYCPGLSGRDNTGRKFDPLHEKTILPLAIDAVQPVFGSLY